MWIFQQHIHVYINSFIIEYITRVICLGNVFELSNTTEPYWTRSVLLNYMCAITFPNSHGYTALREYYPLYK